MSIGRHCVWILSFVLIGLSACNQAESGFELRWMYVSRSLRSDQDVQEIERLATQAAESGLNGILLSAGFSRMDEHPPDYFERLERVKRTCLAKGIEVIPIFLSVGYGTGLSFDKNLAAGIPVTDALFVVKGETATLVPDPPVRIVNGRFERHQAGALPGFSSPEKLGDRTSIDRAVHKEGKASLRFENFASGDRKEGFLRQKIAVHPHRTYMLSCWVKTEGMDQERPFSLGHIRFEVLGSPDGRRLQFLDPRIPVETDWRQVKIGFNSWGYEEVELSIGAHSGDQGRFWLDDLAIEEIGLTSVLRRPGTPITVRSEKGEEYVEGRDFAEISDPELNHRLDHPGPPVQIFKGGRIKEGEKLRVSWYHSMSLYRGQVSVCMSEPSLYEFFRRQIHAVQEHLAPRKYFLSMDEVRAGGSCAACRKRGLSMGEILGDCITRQYQMIKEVAPEADVLTWSDMLDPNHNANPERKYYYLVDGTFEGAWNHVPKEITMAIWGRRVRPASFKHFSSLGFPTLGAAYYDADDLHDVEGWLEVLRHTPGARGIMYTTWLRKYELLPEFGRMVSEAGKLKE